MKITVDLEKIKKVSAEADKILIDPKAEEELVELLKLQEAINEAVDKAKLIIEEEALKLNKNFQSVQADKLKVYYRAYGSRYYIDEKNMHLAPKELYEVEEKINYKIDTKAVEKWVKEHGGMPTGITEVERKKSISMTLKK